MRIKYTKELLGSMGVFARLTGTAVRDCFEMDGVLYFVVEPGEIGKAIGKGGSTVRELQERLKRRIRIIEFHPEIQEFVKNAIYPLKVDSVERQGEILVLKSADRGIKGLLIGRNAKNLNMLKDVVRRYFTVEDIKVE